MTEADKPKYGTLLKALCAAFGVEGSAPLTLAYWMGLESLSIEQVEQAVRRAMLECRFMPKPIELRELAGVVPSATLAPLAFEALKKAINTFGSWKSVDLGPLANATVRNLGGWQRVCSLDSDELNTFFRKDFERVFAALASAGTVSHEQAQHLAGMHEASWTGRDVNGREVPPPPVHRVMDIEALGSAVRVLPPSPVRNLLGAA